MHYIISSRRRKRPRAVTVDYAKPASAKDVLQGDRGKGIAVPTKKSLLLVGTTVVVCPDREGQGKDRGSNYNLGLNIGRIEAINHELKMVDLWWYWGSEWSEPNWILWRVPKTKAAYKEWVSVDDLVCDDLNHIVRIDMESVAKRFKQNKFKMSKDSVKQIKRCLEANKELLDCMSSSGASASVDIDGGCDDDSDDAE